VLGWTWAQTQSVAVAVLQPAASRPASETRCRARPKTACPHKRLADVVLTDRIPCTPSGKILRRELRAMAAEFS
jgi:long-chain acyl-CoA synthetase